MLNLETTMKMTREKIARNKVQLPALHERALELELHPQPWWNVEFYEWAIMRAEED